jgi:hypothetical protein
MNKINGKLLLAAVAIGCLVPSAAAAVAPDHALRNFNWQVPEGGSALVYLVGAGLICFGAMFLRSKLAKPPQS